MSTRSTTGNPDFIYCRGSMSGRTKRRRLPPLALKRSTEAYSRALFRIITFGEVTVQRTIPSQQARHRNPACMSRHSRISQVTGGPWGRATTVFVPPGPLRTTVCELQSTRRSTNPFSIPCGERCREQGKARDQEGLRFSCGRGGLPIYLKMIRWMNFSSILAPSILDWHP